MAWPLCPGRPQPIPGVRFLTCCFPNAWHLIVTCCLCSTLRRGPCGAILVCSSRSPVYINAAHNRPAATSVYSGGSGSLGGRHTSGAPAPTHASVSHLPWVPTAAHWASGSKCSHRCLERLQRFPAFADAYAYFQQLAETLRPLLNASPTRAAAAAHGDRAPSTFDAASPEAYQTPRGTRTRLASQQSDEAPTQR